MGLLLVYTDFDYIIMSLYSADFFLLAGFIRFYYSHRSSWLMVLIFFWGHQPPLFSFLVLVLF